MKEIDEIINRAKRGLNKRVNIPEILKQWDIKQHEIYTNKTRYPDRRVKSDWINPDTGKVEKRERIVPIVRIGLPYQKLIVNTGATFFCGIPVRYTSNNNDEIFNSFSKLIEKEKVKYLDRKIYKEVSKFTECAVLWFVEERENNDYGFKSNFRIKPFLISAQDNEMYPEFSKSGRMVRFSRKFKREDDTEVFESYTDELFEKWEKDGDTWRVAEGFPKENTYKKIPISYYSQDENEWADVQDAIERLEEIYSNIGVSNDRFAFPLLMLKGKVKGQVSSERSGRILELEGDNADGKFVNPDNASETLKNEMDKLEQIIHDFTSTPNITPSNLQGLGQLLSGVAMKYFFLSAHLKVMEKEEIYKQGFDRRVSIIESIMKEVHPEFRNQDLDVNVIITPFTIENKQDLARYILDINNNQPLVSQRMAMEMFGIENPEKMIEEIQNETNTRADYNNVHEFL